MVLSVLLAMRGCPRGLRGAAAKQPYELKYFSDELREARLIMGSNPIPRFMLLIECESHYKG